MKRQVFNKSSQINFTHNRREFCPLQPYTILRDSHIGESCFILGSGTSLYNVDLSGIHKHNVICVNASILLVDWDKGDPANRFWISNDAFCRQWSYWKNIIKSKSTKIVRDSWRSFFSELRGFYVFSPRPTKATIVEPNDTGLCYCSSVPSAMDLAIQMGCKNIFILGVDQYAKGNLRYFWEYWDKNDRPVFKRSMHPISHQSKIWTMDQAVYANLNEFAKIKNAHIYNCSKHSKVKTFDKISLEEAYAIAEEK